MEGQGQRERGGKEGGMEGEGRRKEGIREGWRERVRGRDG